MGRKGMEIATYHHIFNRGVEKRIIFPTVTDLWRFVECMEVFNTKEPVGSLLESRFQKGNARKKKERLVDIICFCLNTNHFHMLLRQNTDTGIAEFMRRLIGGYTRYFNIKNKRRGVLFQGKYKSIPILTDEYLLHLSAYINLNNRVHRLGSRTTKSSWEEYIKGNKGMCEKDIILSQFAHRKEYQIFAFETLENILEKKSLTKELEDMLLE
jgi:REP element-mobilizing transposase RayT